MKKLLLAALGAAMLSSVAPAPVLAGVGVIDRACRKADRAAATPQLCKCIQKVANSSLNMRERRKVAKFFRDPHKAQQVRQSERPGDEVLWKRYRAFGDKARASCGASS